MSRQALIWIRRAAVALITLLLRIVLCVALIAGTESGTRWVLGKASTALPIDLDADRVSGTLLTQLDIPSVRYSDAKLVLNIEDLTLNVDWSQSSPSHITLERLTVKKVELQSTGTAESRPSPLEISMPELPIGISASEILLDAMTLNDPVVSGI